jgi:N4-gp56 family major capsid protein
MAPDVRATGDVSSIVGYTYDKKMLERLINRAVLYNLAEKRSVPTGGGTTIYFNRFTNFPVPKTKLTEGEVPTISYLSGTSVTATLYQLGAFTAVSDVLTLTSFSKVVSECVENFGDSAADCVDKFIFSNIVSEHATDNPMSMLNGDDVTLTTWFGAKQGGLSTVFLSADALWFTAYAGALWNYMSVTGNCHAGIGSGYSLDLDKIAIVAAQLRANNARPFADGYYKAVISSKALAQIMRTSEWAGWNTYTRPEVLDKGEVGRAYGVRFYESNVIYTHHSDVLSQYTNLCAYFTPIFGQGAFAVTELEATKGVKTYIKNPNEYDTSNPINQWSTIGWKVGMAAKTLNANCGYVLMTLG